jgi:hypothetical protein
MGLEELTNDDFDNLHSQSHSEHHQDLISTKLHPSLVLIEMPPNHEIIYATNSTLFSSVDIEKVEVSVHLPTIDTNNAKVNVESQKLLVIVNKKRG